MTQPVDRKKSDPTESNSDDSPLGDGYDAAVHGTARDGAGTDVDAEAQAFRADVDPDALSFPGNDEVNVTANVQRAAASHSTEDVAASWGGDIEEDIAGDVTSERDTVEELALLSGATSTVPGADLDAPRGDNVDDVDRYPSLSGEALRAKALHLATAHSDDERNQMRQALLQRYQELETVIAANRHAAEDILVSGNGGDTHVDYNHPADMLEGDVDLDKYLQVAHRQKAELELVAQALHRLDAGEFGICLSCGEDIAWARLRAVPYAKCCMACQENGDETARSAVERVAFFQRDAGAAHAPATEFTAP